MAKNVGAFPITGSLKGLNFYVDEDHGNIVRSMPGPSREKVKNDPAFERTRNHNKDFTRASEYGALLRRAFHFILMQRKDKTMHYQLTDRIYDLLKLGGGGEGDMQMTTAGVEAFRHFETNTKCLSKQYFMLPVSATAENGKMEGSVGLVLHQSPAAADAWKLRSIAATVDFVADTFNMDAFETPIMFFGSDQYEIAFSHTYEEGKLLFHGMGIEFYKHDPVIDEYKLLDKALNCGWMRFVGGEI